MQQQGKSSGTKSSTQKHKKMKALGSGPTQERGKGTPLTHAAKGLVKHAKADKLIFSSDAARNLDGVRYRLGDMVWAKVKSHPWWPGQLYDPALASSSTLDFKRDSCFLVAFFGDGTFNWFAEAELIPYEPNFAQKSKQTSEPSFKIAVDDSLDEFCRRVKLGLTCHCSTLEEACESEGKKAGLLYDRQLRDIRRTFEPAKLLSTIKQLARSPFSSSENMLRSTVAGVQTDAFRLLASCQKLPEHQGVEGLGESSQSNHIKTQHPDNVESAEFLREQHVIKKHKPKLSKSCQEQKESTGKQALKEKFAGVDDWGKSKQQTKNAISKKESKEKSKGFHEAKVTASEKKSVQPVDCGVEDIQATSASVGEEIQARKPLSTQRGIQGSGQDFEQSESYLASVSSKRATPGLVVMDSLTSSHDKAQPRRIKKKVAGLAVKSISKEVSEADVTEPNAALEKAKVAKVEEDRVVESKVAQKLVLFDAEDSQVRKKVKVVSGRKDRVFKQPKRVLEDAPTDVLSRETKRRKRPHESTGKNYIDDSLSDHIADSIASDSLPTSGVLQLPDKVTSGQRDLQSDFKLPPVESLVSVETVRFEPAETSEIAPEVGQSLEKEAFEHKHVDDDATEAQDVGAGLSMQPSKPDADHKSINSSQAEITSSINNEKEEKVKVSNLSERREVSTSQAKSVSDVSKEEKTAQDMTTDDLLKPDGFLNHVNDTKGQGDGERLEKSPKVVEDLRLKDSNISPSEADPILSHFQSSSSVEGLMCTALENVQDANQTMKEASSGKSSKEEKKSFKKNMELKHFIASNKVSSSKKRAVQECPSKSLKGTNKRIKTTTLEREAECHADSGGEHGQEHEGLTREDEEDTHLENLHESLVSVAAKPLDAVEESFSCVVPRDFTKFKKVINKKQVYPTCPKNSVTSSPIAESEGVVGHENDKMAAAVTKQAEVKAISSSNPSEAEPSKVEDARIQEGGDGLITQKQSAEDGTASQLKATKRSITSSKPPSSSSISLRPAFEAKIPVRGSKEVLNRFGQRVLQFSDPAERTTSFSSRMQSYAEERALVISFPRGFVLPSEKQLRDTFAKFGDLNVPLTRVDSKRGYAHIVFRHTKDAVAALSSMKENPVFENARFWLKPKDADIKETGKLDSRNIAFSEKPILSSGQLSEAKIDAVKVRQETSSDKGLLVRPSKDVVPAGGVDKIGVTKGISSRMTEVCGKEGALLSIYGGNNPPPSPMKFNYAQKSPLGALGPGQRKLDGICPDIVASSSVLLKAGPRSLGSPSAADIKEPFLALLHQLHDLVVSTGFVM